MLNNLYNPTDSTDRIRGIVFNNSNVRNVFIGAENFMHMYSCLYFLATLDKSTIDKFEVRDVVYYAENLSSNMGSYLRCDNLYKSISISIMVPYYQLSSVAEPVYMTNYLFDKMLVNPVLTFTPTYQSSNITYQFSTVDVVITAIISCTANTSPSGDWPRSLLQGTLVLDATTASNR